MEKKIESNINRDYFEKMGINPQEAVSYLLNKKAGDLKPIHVMALQVLKKQQPVPS
jgi:hypothetical protein